MSDTTSNPAFSRNNEEKVELTDEQWKKVVEVMDNQVSGFLDDLIYETVVDFREGEFN